VQTGGHCRRHLSVSLGHSREVILGQILHGHVRSDIVDAESTGVDPAWLGAIARLGDDTCITIRDCFEMDPLILAE
jgi:flavin reductase (DIM6/NTAB) family NADH-FMN oxidoreductase RutF